MITGSKFLFSLGKVERCTVGLGVTSNEIDDESGYCRYVTLEDVPSVGLITYNLLYVHCSGEHNHCEHAYTDGKFVADNHGTTSDSTDESILAVTAPSGKQDTQHTD